MKAIIDNNVIIDAIVSRQPFNASAERIMLLIGNGEIDGYITSNSLTDIFYVLKKMTNTITAKEAIVRLLKVFYVVTVGSEECKYAIELPIDDFEDALIAVCSENCSADYIVTRDEVFLKSRTKVPVINPVDLIKRLDSML